MQELQTTFMGRLLRRLTYAQKFLIIGLLFASSLTISMYVMMQAQNQAIKSVEDELQGSQYIRNLRKLLEAIPEHALLSNRYLSGETTVKNDLINVQNSINSYYKNLLAIDSELQVNMHTTAEEMQMQDVANIRPAEIEKRWEEMNRRPEDMTIETSFAQHQRLAYDLILLMRHIGEGSKQSLDADLITFRLLEISLTSLPQTAITIPSIVILANRLLHDQDSVSLRNAVAGQLTLLKYLIARSKEGMDKILALSRQDTNDQELLNRLRDPYKQYIEATDELISYIENTVLTNKQAVPADLFLFGSKSINAAFGLWDSIYDQTDRLLYERINRLKWQQKIWVTISLLNALIGFWLGYQILREITRPLQALIKAGKLIAAGDLSVRVPISHTDEVGQLGSAFNLIAESFQELIGRLQWTGIQLTTSTTEIAAAAKQQEATVVEQEATTKEIAVTAHEISSTAKEFAKTMNEVSSTAEQTSALASSGKAGLTRMETIMRQMVDASANIASKLGVLSEKAGNITTVITTINKVAEQTNLLSLNAAIEAEKAGEHGRSFAVIAREIRRLADQTGNATLDIEKMVNEIVSAVSAGVMGVDKFSEEIHTGVGQVSIVSEQLSKIIEQVQLLTTSFENVNQGMQTQSLGAEQINESITQLSDAAQQTTESIRQFHNAIEQLNNAAIEMQNAVSKLKR